MQSEPPRSSGLPRKDILRMIVPQIDLRRPSNRCPLCLPVIRGQQTRLHRLLNPHRLTPRRSRHLLHIWKIELSLVRLVGRCEEVLLPRLPKQPRHRHLTLRQGRGVAVLLEAFLATDPPAVDEHSAGAFPAFEGRNDEVAVVAVVYARPDQHLFGVEEVAGGVDAAVVEVGDGGGIDAWGEGEGRADEAVFEFGD